MILFQQIEQKKSEMKIGMEFSDKDRTVFD